MHDDHGLLSDPLWVYAQAGPFREEVIREFHFHPAIADTLIARGFSSLEQIHRFLYAQLPDLHDPFLMSGMSRAVDRICQAIELSQNILIYGDHDVDGMTGTALLCEFFTRIGANVFFHISGRTILRQGLYIDALEHALKNDCRLMITVDCGITAAAEIAQVIEKNVDVIVTDHHEPTDQIPFCIATLNPKLLHDAYPNRELTGVGVAFKLAHAITQRLVSDGKISEKKIDLKRLLDLVALGTVADMGALQGENRILVRYGMQQLRRNKRIGLAKLMLVCEVDPIDLSTFDIALKIAPRLNSLGRIDDPDKGVKLLLMKNHAQTGDLALELDLNNIERRKIERLVSEDVDQLIHKQGPSVCRNRAIVLFSEKWHSGVIAIISARISRQYNRPTAIFAIEKSIAKGSLRSIRGFPLLPVLKENKDLMLNFGGHDFAAGCTMKRTALEMFSERFITAANEVLCEEDVQNKIYLDSEVQFRDLTFDFLEAMKLLEPFGNENPAPVFHCEVIQTWPAKMVGTMHMRLFLEQDGRIFEGFAYNLARYFRPLQKKKNRLRIAFTPQFSAFKQNPGIQLLIRAIQILEG